MFPPSIVPAPKPERAPLCHRCHHSQSRHVYLGDGKFGHCLTCQKHAWPACHEWIGKRR